MNEIKMTVNLNGGGTQDITLTDDHIINGTAKLYENIGLIAQTLEPDVFTFDFIDPNELLLDGGILYTLDGERILTPDGQPIFTMQGQYIDADFSHIVQDSPVYWYRDGLLEAKLYLHKITKKPRSSVYHVEARSAVALLINKIHTGGMYVREPIGNALAEIFGSIPYSVSAEVLSETLTGHLKYGSARDNLLDCLYQCGASVSHDANGNPYICYAGEGSLVSIAEASGRIYAGTEPSETSNVTAVEITEHSFNAYNDDEETTLFDNTDGSVAAASALVVFSEPCHDLVATGLTIEESNCNYAVVSGLGTLTGKVYTHTTRIVRRSTGLSGIENVRSSSDCELINPLNSVNTAKRAAAYFASTDEVNGAVVLANDLTIKPIANLRLTPASGDVYEGYIEETTKTLSYEVGKSAVKIRRNWTPSALGNNYDSYLIITAADLISGQWQVPAELQGQSVQVVLFSGADGGDGAYNGGNGGQTRLMVNAFPIYSPFGTLQGYEFGSKYVAGGQGGKAGAGGHGSRFLVFNVASLAASYAVSFGAGGDGGAANGGAGAAGADSTFGSYSTQNAQRLQNYMNLVDGTIYGEDGDAGEDGADGGGAGGKATALYLGATWSDDTDGLGRNGENGFDSETATGGAKTNNVYTQNEQLNRFFYYQGSGGGGAAHGVNGSDSALGATPTTPSSYEEESASYAGDGASPVSAPAQTTLGKGGGGGHGGGGGGTAGCTILQRSTSSGYSYVEYVNPHTAQGGTGTAGGKGSDGFALIYYKGA